MLDGFQPMLMGAMSEATIVLVGVAIDLILDMFCIETKPPMKFTILFGLFGLIGIGLHAYGVF